MSKVAIFIYRFIGLGDNIDFESSVISLAMESILLSLVSSYLKDYVNNFRKEQISVSIRILWIQNEEFHPR